MPQMREVSRQDGGRLARADLGPIPSVVRPARFQRVHGRPFEVTTASVSSPVSTLGRALARLFDLAVTVDVEMTPYVQ
jgi:hypothetical protein